MGEWLKPAVLKTVCGELARGFESLFLRHVRQRDRPATLMREV